MLCTVFFVISCFAAWGHERHETKLLSGLTPGAVVLKHRCIIFPCWHFLGPLKSVLPTVDDISISGQSRPLQCLLVSHVHFSTLHNSKVSQQRPCHFFSPLRGLVSWCLWPYRRSLSVMSSLSRSACDHDSFLFLKSGSHLGWSNRIMVPCLSPVQGVHLASRIQWVLRSAGFYLISSSWCIQRLH